MALTKSDLAAIAALIDARIAVAAPAAGAASSQSRPRTFATKAERAAGAGFSCSCGRNDLRVAPHSGSFHKAPDGTTTHTVA